MSDRDAVLEFWAGMEAHDWSLVRSSLAEDFVRVGLRGDEEDTCHGADAYVSYVSRVLDRVHSYSLKVRRTFASADGRNVVVETVERIRPTADAVDLVFSIASVIELSDEGLVKRLDMYSKTLEQAPPAWLTDYDARSLLSSNEAGT